MVLHLFLMLFFPFSDFVLSSNFSLMFLNDYNKKPRNLTFVIIFAFLCKSFCVRLFSSKRDVEYNFFLENLNFKNSFEDRAVGWHEVGTLSSY